MKGGSIYEIYCIRKYNLCKFISIRNNDPVITIGNNISQSHKKDSGILIKTYDEKIINYIID